jgi:hypothetical protein
VSNTGIGLASTSPEERAPHQFSNSFTDAEFLGAFESCTLAADAFRHYEHIRLAWIYLGAAPLEEATVYMGAAICRFALHRAGTTAKYNAPLTRAWMHLVARARAVGPPAATFAEFAAVNPVLFDRARAFDFYGVPAP